MRDVPARPLVSLLAILAILGIALAACALPGCGRTARAEPAERLDTFRYAVVSFPNHMALKDRATADLGKLGLEVVEAKDVRLQRAEDASATLWFEFTVDHRPAGDTVRARAVDRAGAELYDQRATGITEPLAVDAALQALGPRIAPQPAGKDVIEL